MSSPGSPRTRAASRLLPAVWLSLVVPAAWAAEARSDADSASPQSRSHDEQGGTADAEHQKRVVQAAGYVLLGILSLGVALIALVMLWGRRMRRIARKPLPRQSPRDELWYLRPKKVPPARDAQEQDEEQP